MAYIPPYIDAAGLHIPTYIDIRDDLIAEFKRIYGQDIYLDNDSQDYQMISAFALKTYDAIQLLQVIYNNRGPKTAVGSALDGVVKLNGIRRKAASYSTCLLTITGDIGTTIKNGAVQDDAGIAWALPEVVVIKEAPQRVTAVCRTIGAIEAAPGSIAKISTPTKGWISATNEVPAVTGLPVETDEELRRRQSISVAIPSRTLLDGAVGGIAGVNGVKRYKIYENDSNLTNKHGIPGHSIAAVVEGGADEDVAAQIYLRKGIGCGTHGDVEFEYTHADGLVNLIRFSRPQYVTVNALLHIRRLDGCTVEIEQRIISQVKAYIQSLDIGNDIVVSSVWAAALSALPTLTQPAFSVQCIAVARRGDALAPADIIFAFNEVARAGDILIEVV